MKERIGQEMKLLQTHYPNAEWHPNNSDENNGGWIRIPDFVFPKDVWDKNSADVCFEVKQGYPGTAPYAFYVLDGLALPDGTKPTDYSIVQEPPFGGSWGKFSWANDNSWRPTGDLVSGSNLLNFVSTFNDRLCETP